MAQGYLSQGSQAQFIQLNVQELVVQITDSIVTTSGSTATIDVGQAINTVVGALFADDSAATVAPVVAANRVISGTTVKLTLSAPLAANDFIILNFTCVN